LGRDGQKGSYFKAQFRWLSGRLGKQRALLAVAHTLLTIVYHLLRDPKLEYRELGADYFDQWNAEQTAAHLMKRLGKPGYEVTVRPKAA